MSAVAEPTALNHREEAAKAILPLLTDEPQSGAALSRKLLPREGKRAGKRVHSANVIRSGLDVLVAQHKAMRIPQRGWVRYHDTGDAASNGDQASEVDITAIDIQFDYDWAVLPIDEMFVDEYQRPVTSLVAQIVRNFQPHLFQTLLVSDRGESRRPRYAVIDGQTRWAAATRLNLGRPVPCLVFTGLSPQDEARLFAAIQRNRKNMTSVDRFRAEVFAQDEQALKLTALVEANGYKIGNGTGEIKGVAALETCYKRDEFLLARLLSDLKEAWPDYVPEAGVIRGMHLFFREYPIGEDVKKDVDDEKLVRRLQVSGRHGIEDKARAARQFLGKGTHSERYYGMAIQNAYESRAKS